MARRFTRTTDRIEITCNPVIAPTLSFSTFTVVSVLRRVSDGGASSHAILTLATTGGAARRGQVAFATSNVLEYYSGSNSSSGTQLLTSEGWALISVCKAAGSVIPRHHRFIYATNTPQHLNGSGATSDSVAVGAGGMWWIGGAAGVTDSLDAHVAAMAFVPRVMTDSEIERLARGNWTQLIPEAYLHVEFPSGGDNPSGVLRDLSPQRQLQTGISGTSRSPLSDPPGFRFSPMALRR